MVRLTARPLPRRRRVPLWCAGGSPASRAAGASPYGALTGSPASRALGASPSKAPISHTKSRHRPFRRRRPVPHDAPHRNPHRGPTEPKRRARPCHDAAWKQFFALSAVVEHLLAGFFPDVAAPLDFATLRDISAEWVRRGRRRLADAARRLGHRDRSDRSLALSWSS